MSIDDTPKKRGFASLSPDKLRAISSKGGKSRGKPKGYATLSPEERSSNATNAAIARWKKIKAEREQKESQ